VSGVVPPVTAELAAVSRNMKGVGCKLHYPLTCPLPDAWFQMHMYMELSISLSVSEQLVRRTFSMRYSVMLNLDSGSDTGGTGPCLLTLVCKKLVLIGCSL
jgi:hypothetical protein